MDNAQIVCINSVTQQQGGGGVLGWGGFYQR